MRAALSLRPVALLVLCLIVVACQGEPAPDRAPAATAGATTTASPAPSPAQPGAGAPDLAQPGAGAPDLAQPGAGAPDLAQPGAGAEPPPVGVWPPALAAHLPADTLLALSLQPARLLEALRSAMTLLADTPEAFGLGPVQVGLLQLMLAADAAGPASLLSVDALRRFGIDPTRPAGLFVAPTAERWRRLRAAAVGAPPDPDAIAAAGASMALLVRLVVPAADPDLASRSLADLLDRLPLQPTSIEGYARAYHVSAEARVPLGLRQSGDAVIIESGFVLDQLDAPAHDAAFRALVAASAPGAAPPLPGPTADDVLFFSADVDALGTLDRLIQSARGVDQSAIYATIDAFSRQSPFESVSIALSGPERQALTLRGHLRVAQPDAVAALARRVSVGLEAPADAMLRARLNTALVASTGPWASAGLSAPPLITFDLFQQTFTMGSSLLFTPPLWLAALPSLGWRQAPPAARAFDVARGVLIDVVLFEGFDPERARERFALVALDPGGDLTGYQRLLACAWEDQPLDADDCDPSRVQTGQPAEQRLDDRTIHYLLAQREGHVVFIASLSQAIRDQLAAAPLTPSGEPDGATVLRLDLDDPGALLAIPALGVDAATRERLAGLIEGGAAQLTAYPDRLDMVFETTGTLSPLRLIIIAAAWAAIRALHPAP